LDRIPVAAAGGQNSTMSNGFERKSFNIFNILAFIALSSILQLLSFPKHLITKKLRRVTGEEAIRALERLGLIQVRQPGSHVVLKKQVSGGEVGCVFPPFDLLFR
jgi:predicted RNA binding protein YcfA (HicA-like mRNA interferase family)